MIELIWNKKKGPSVETERPLTIACHMKILKNIFELIHSFLFRIEVILQLKLQPNLLLSIFFIIHRL